MSEACDLASKLSAISNAFTLEKRFDKNYEVMSQIGIGGFAKVVKARHLLDDMEYAIKQIKIETKNKTAFQVVNELEQMLGEIRCFAKIKHKHIVRYNHSWIEVELKENQTKDEKFTKEKKLLENKFNCQKALKSKDKNSKKNHKNNLSHYSYLESSGKSCDFSEGNYECEISWEGINNLEKLNSNELYVKKEEKLDEKKVEENYSFESSFYLEEASQDGFAFNNKIVKENSEFESEFPEFCIHPLGKIENNKVIKKKNYKLEKDDSDNEIQFIMKSVSRIKKIKEDLKPEAKEENIKRGKNSNLKKIVVNEVEELNIPINDKQYKFSDIKKFTIFLQMELCKQTLEDFLKEKQTSKKLAEALDKDKYFEDNHNPINYQKELLENLEIFLEINKAINYLHDFENIIHRDIKPKNIFISYDGNIKVGDFGLATHFFNDKYSEKENSKIRKNSLESKTTAFTRSSSPPTSSNNELNNYCNAIPNENCNFYHTKNIGTLLYSSPEQLNNNFYDYKSDVFSLGLVLFELLSPFNTQMEKNMKFQQIKKGKIQEDLLMKEPCLAKLVLSMCHEDPKARPNTKDIMKIILKEISNKYCLILESNVAEDSAWLSLKDDQYSDFISDCRNSTVSSLTNGNELFEKASFLKIENFDDFELKKARSYESNNQKLSLLKNTIKYLKKTEDICMKNTNGTKNLLLLSPKNIQGLEIKDLGKDLSFKIKSKHDNIGNLNIEQIQNKRLRILSTEIETNYSKERLNDNDILSGIGFYFEKEYCIKENEERISSPNFILCEKNRIYLQMYENSLLLFFNEDSNKPDKIYDLFECKINIKIKGKSQFTQISLEIPFYCNAYILLDNTNKNNKIIEKIKKENCIN